MIFKRLCLIEANYQDQENTKIIQIHSKFTPNLICAKLGISEKGFYSYPWGDQGIKPSFSFPTLANTTTFPKASKSEIATIIKVMKKRLFRFDK